MHLEAADPVPSAGKPQSRAAYGSGQGGKQSGGCLSLYRHFVT